MKWKHPWWLSWYYVYIKIYHSVMQHTAAKYLWCKTTGVSLDYLSNPPDALSRNSIQCSTGIILKSETSEDTENKPSCQSPIHTAIYSANTATYLGESSTQKIMFCLITINNPITRIWPARVEQWALGLLSCTVVRPSISPSHTLMTGALPGGLQFLSHHCHSRHVPGILKQASLIHSIHVHTLVYSSIVLLFFTMQYKETLWRSPALIL